MFSPSFTRLVSVAALASSALAHMALQVPPPLRSKFNPNYSGANGGLVDFSITSPLNADGSNFPCKGYQVDVPKISNVVATLAAGQSFNIGFQAGGAPHEGGSCQFSVSVDGGKTWGVIQEEIGGCPLQSNYTVQVPANLPKADRALFSWTWFNKVGNREMYQNCVDVKIDGSSTAPIQLKKMYVANIGNGCTTIEGQEIDFKGKGVTGNCPDPGTVTLGGSGSGGSQAPAAPAPPPPSSEPSSTQPTSTGTAAPAPTAGGDNGSNDGDEDCEDDNGADDGDYDNGDDCPPETGTSAPAPEAPAPTSSTPEPSAAPAPPAAPPANAPSNDGTCTGGAIQCSADGKSWAMCANGKFMQMGSVAPGMKCVNGQHVRDGANSTARVKRAHWATHARREMTFGKKLRLSREH